MSMIAVLWPILCLIGFVGFVWLCVVAFKHHVGWGLLVLFLSPITAIVFAIKHWHEAKKPFLVYMGSFGACIVLVVYTISTVGMQMMALAQEAGSNMRVELAAEPIDAEVEVEAPTELAVAPHVSEVAELPRGTEPQPEALAVREPATSRVAGEVHASLARLSIEPPPESPVSEGVPLGFQPVPVNQATNHIGKNVRIVGKDGKEIEGRLAEAGPQTLSVERILSGGTISVELAASDVEALLVADY